jgi:hypothetical protein
MFTPYEGTFAYNNVQILLDLCLSLSLIYQGVSRRGCYER